MSQLTFQPITLRTLANHTTMSATPQLYYMHESKWSLLPNWGQFFLNIGSMIAANHSTSHRIVAGFAVPVRAFAASLTATGVATALATTTPFTAEYVTQHAEWFRSLPAGTPLVYRKRNNTLQKCTFDQWFIQGGEPRVRVKLECAGNSTATLPPSLLLGVEKLSDEAFTLPRHQAIRRIVSDRELAFLSAYLGQGVARELIMYSRLDCLVIGPIGQIQEEMRETRFAVEGVGSGFVEGSLNMIARLRPFLTDSSAYRADIYAQTHAPKDFVTFKSPPAVVIFSGATSFLTWRDFCRTSHWVVILDRTDPHFQEATTELNQEYILKRADQELRDNLPTVPSEIEAVWYQEAL